jgi:hypothetical protein
MAAGDARVTQEAVEVLVIPDTSIVFSRTTQLAVEVLIAANVGDAIVTQLAVEVLIGAATGGGGSGTRSQVVIVG